MKPHTYRHYDPRTGRFISEDPIGFSGGDSNLYRYVRNMPLMFKDSSGYQEDDDSDNQDSKFTKFVDDAGKKARDSIADFLRETADRTRRELERLKDLTKDTKKFIEDIYDWIGDKFKLDDDSPKNQCSLRGPH